MAVCPNGHDSVSDDFCDTCGMRIGGSPPSGSSPPGSLQSGSHATGSSPASGATSSAWPDPAAPAAESCPRCGTPRNGQFCEACGHNFVGPRFTPTTASAPAPSAARGYSQSQPGPGGSGSGPPAPGSGGYSSAQAPPPAPPLPAGPLGSSCPGLPIDILVSVSAGHLDRGGGRRPGLLRAGADGHRVGRHGRHLSLLLRRTPFPARREPDADRAAQRIARPGSGDRPDRTARRSGHQPAARGADRDGGRQLGRARSGFGQRHAGQRFGDPASATRYPCTTAIASTSAPGPRSPCTEVRKFSIASTASAYNDGRLQALTYAHDHQPVLAGPRRGRPGSRGRRQR